MSDAKNDYEVVYEDGKPVAVRIRLERRKGPDEWTTVDWVDWPRVKKYRWGPQRQYAVNASAGMLHRLITRAPEGMDVHHIDGNGFNNRRANLEVLTRSEHMSEHGDDFGKASRRAWANGAVDREAHRVAVGRANASLTDDQVLEARRLYATGDWTYAQLAEKYEVSYQVIYEAVRGDTYKWVPHVAHKAVAKR